MITVIQEKLRTKIIITKSTSQSLRGIGILSGIKIL